MNKATASPEFKASDLKNAIKLTDFKNKGSAPPSYHSHMMAEAEKSQHRDAALLEKSNAKQSLRQNYRGTDANHPSTAEEILYEHVLSRRLESNEKLREYKGDVVVDWCVTITKTLTIIFIIFMIVCTGYQWWSLGPHYAKNYEESDPRLHPPGYGR